MLPCRQPLTEMPQKTRQPKSGTTFKETVFCLPDRALAGAADRQRFRRLLILIAVVYALTFGSEPVTNLDDQVMLASAMSLVKTGKLIAPERFAAPAMGRPTFGRIASTGEVFLKFPPGYPLVLAAFLLPARAAGLAFGSTAAEVILCLPSILVLLAAATLIWRTSLRLAYRPATGLCLAAGFALGSFAWPYAGINFSEPFQMLCVLAGFYCLLAAQQEEDHWKQYTVYGSLALGYAILTKASLVVFAAVLTLAALAAWSRRLPILAAFKRAVAFAAPSVIAGVYLLAINSLLFGNVTEFGYGMETFSAPFLVGLFGLTLSFERGVLWFAPLILLAPWGAIRLVHDKQRWPALALSSAAVLYLILISLWGGYQGGNCWGPRLLAPILPYVILLAGAAVNAAGITRVGWALVAAGILVNCLGVMVNYQSFYVAARSSNAKFPRRKAVYSQIPGHFWLLRVELTKPAWNAPEDQSPLWQKPPWIRQFPEAIPKAYNRADVPVLNPWPLRLKLPPGRMARADAWYLRSLLEVALIRWEAREYREALALGEEGLRIEPRYKAMAAALGMVHFSMGNLTRALYHYDLSLASDPDYELGLYGKGMALEAMRNYAAARSIYQRLLALPPKELNAEEIRSRLQRLDY
jgi:hypothetical protein